MNRVPGIIRHLIGKYDFWSIRDPESLQGFPRPSETLQGLTGCEFLAELSHSDPIIQGAVGMVSNRLFDYRRADEQHFEIECADPELHRLIETELLHIHAGEGHRKFGYGIYSLEGFLRAKAAEIMTYGRSCTRLNWEQSDVDDTHWTLRSLRGLFPDNVSQIRKGATVVRYEWRHRQNEHDPNSPIRIEYLDTEDVLNLEWVFDGEENRGKSPLERVVKYYRERRKFMTLSVAMAYAGANPGDRRFWVERARYTDVKKAIEEESQRKVLITKELRVTELYSPPPMTTYYEVYDWVKYERRVAQIREYLVSQFNEQVVKRLAEKNSFSAEVKLRTVGYQHPEDIDSIFKQFERRELTADEVVKMLR